MSRHVATPTHPPPGAARSTEPAIVVPAKESRRAAGCEGWLRAGLFLDLRRFRDFGAIGCLGPTTICSFCLLHSLFPKDDNLGQ